MPLHDEDCVSCNGDEPKLTEEQIKQQWLETPMWQIEELDGEKRLRRNFEFDSYSDALSFAAQVGEKANQQNHHPEIVIRYNSVTIDWWTHSIGGLHKNDFIMASKSDKTYLETLDNARKKSVVTEASEQSFPASDSPGWIGKTTEDEKTNAPTTSS